MVIWILLICSLISQKSHQHQHLNDYSQGSNRRLPDKPRVISRRHCLCIVDTGPFFKGATTFTFIIICRRTLYQILKGIECRVAHPLVRSVLPIARWTNTQITLPSRSLLYINICSFPKAKVVRDQIRANPIRCLVS